jgi:hypothetical protein
MYQIKKNQSMRGIKINQYVVFLMYSREHSILVIKVILKFPATVRANANNTSKKKMSKFYSILGFQKS